MVPQRETLKQIKDRIQTEREKNKFLTTAQVHNIIQEADDQPEQQGDDKTSDSDDVVLAKLSPLAKGNFSLHTIITGMKGLIFLKG